MSTIPNQAQDDEESDGPEPGTEAWVDEHREELEAIRESDDPDAWVADRVLRNNGYDPDDDDGEEASG